MKNLLSLHNIRALASIRIILAISTFILFGLIAFSSDSVSVIISTFLGSNQRNYYGENAPDKLDVIYKVRLGCGYTVYAGQTMRQTTLIFTRGKGKRKLR